MKYESSTSSGTCIIKVLANIKVFVHTTDANTRAMTLAPRTYLSWPAKKLTVLVWLTGLSSMLLQRNFPIFMFVLHKYHTDES